MSDTKKHSSLSATLAVCTLFVALISFFLPFVSINFLGKHSFSTIELIKEIIDHPEFPEAGLLISLVCTILGIVFSLLALKNRGMAVGTIITSAVGMVFMIVLMTDKSGYGLSLIDYAGIGFYLYEIASLAAILLSISARHTSKSAESSADGRIPSPAPKPAPMPAPKPVPPAPGPIPTKKTICPNCKAEQKNDAAFCRFCGTPINNSKSISPKPAPAPEPRPNPVPTPTSTSTAKAKDGKVMCPHCGARHVTGTTYCKYCGTAIVETSHAKADPVLVEDPIPAPVYKPISTNKAERKAICPHCGARQSEDAINCKYCGTAMK